MRNLQEEKLICEKEEYGSVKEVGPWNWMNLGIRKGEVEV